MKFGLPGLKMFEYALVLHPHEDLRRRIRQVRADFAEAFENENALFSRPQITLCVFKQYALAEERIVNHLHTIAMAAKPFKVELKDFGSFPSHSIFIKVASKIPLQTLIKQVRTETQRLMKVDEENKPHFLMEPYIIIGRKLSPWQYEKAWLEYGHKHFSGRFIADAMLLLKREPGATKYEVAGRFQFQNLPVTTSQGELF